MDTSPILLHQEEDEEMSLLSCGKTENDIERQYRDTQHLWVQLVNFNPFNTNPPRPHCSFCKLERKIYMQSILTQLFSRVQILLVLTSKRRSVENRMFTMLMCLDRMEKRFDESCRARHVDASVISAYKDDSSQNVQDSSSKTQQQHMLSYNRFVGLGHVFRLICTYQIRHFTQPLRARSVRVMKKASENVREILTKRISEYILGPPPKLECTARPKEMLCTPLPLVCTRVAPPILVAATNAILSGRSVVLMSNRGLTTDTFQSLLQLLSPLPLAHVVTLFLPFLKSSTCIQNAMRKNLNNLRQHAESGTNPHCSGPFMFLGCEKTPAFARILDETQIEFAKLKSEYSKW
jgi:hypothetical protein